MSEIAVQNNQPNAARLAVIADGADERVPLLQNQRQTRINRITSKQKATIAGLVISSLLLSGGAFLLTAALSKRVGDVFHIPSITKNHFPGLLGAVGMAAGVSGVGVSTLLLFHYQNKKVRERNLTLD